MIEFPPQFFSDNRAALLKSSNADVLLVIANGHLQRNGDNAYPFRQDSNFWYLTGIELPNVIWAYDKRSDDQWLILPERSEVENIFDGEVVAEELMSRSGIPTVRSHEEGWKHLRSVLKTAQSVATPHPAPSFIENIGLYTNPARAHLMNELREAGVNRISDLRETLALQRQIKQPIEIKALQKAINVTCETMSETVSSLSTYSYEYEVEASLSSGYRKRGASGHAFPPIVASGAHACTLHYLANNAKLAHGAFVLLDTGAEVSNYAADITRCYPVGNVSQRQIDIYTAVYEAQQVGIKAIKPGVTFKELDAKVNDFLTEELEKLRLKPIGGKNLLRSYYPHAWHWLGLDVHDVGDYERPLEPGMVLTVEPGIYIAAESIGIRLEDDVLVTKTGSKVLSSNLPSHPDAIFAKREH